MKISLQFCTIFFLNLTLSPYLRIKIFIISSIYSCVKIVALWSHLTSMDNNLNKLDATLPENASI